jgi:hypothetical protein
MEDTVQSSSPGSASKGCLSRHLKKGSKEWCKCNTQFSVQSVKLGFNLSRLPPPFQDNISSINLGQGCTAIVYEDAYFEGASLAFSDVGHTNLSSIGFNDMISSVKCSCNVT